MLSLIQDAADAGKDGDILYQAQINTQQAMMWLRKALAGDTTPGVPQQAPEPPPVDQSPPPEDAARVGPREHGGTQYWWRWRDRKWVTFNELPEESQVSAMNHKLTVV
jgi:hypothetical protein